MSDAAIGCWTDGGEHMLPAGPWDIILADPPYAYRPGTATPNRRIENQYDTMPLGAIAALPVAEICGRDALLLLWSTTPKLEEAIALLRAWEFDYRTAFTWVKSKIGPGYWCRQRVEHLLVGVRGRFPTPKPSLRVDSVITEPEREHSRKPDAVYEIVERYWPETRRLELFARGPARPGWAVWGLEARPTPAT